MVSPIGFVVSVEKPFDAEEVDKRDEKSESRASDEGRQGVVIRAESADDDDANGNGEKKSEEGHQIEFCLCHGRIP